VKPVLQRAAIYARVSSHRQQKQATVESQLADLRERVGRDGVGLLEEHILVDDGHSGSYLDRPGLDRLRDLVHERIIDVVYVHSPDRLARRYAYQAILIDEFNRSGCQLIFLNHTPSQDPEGQLLVQIQGVIAEYERAKITERLRRGKLHRARQGVVVSWKAPYGYRYIPRQGEVAGGWEVNEAEAPAIPTLFGWVRDEGISIRQATQRLNASLWRPRGGRPLWAISSVRAMLINPAYTGVCYYNKRRWIESDRTDRLFRKNRKTKSVLRPREEWIAVPIPALVDEATFTRVQEQLKNNQAFLATQLGQLRCLWPFDGSGLPGQTHLLPLLGQCGSRQHFNAAPLSGTVGLCSGSGPAGLEGNDVSPEFTRDHAGGLQTAAGQERLAGSRRSGSGTSAVGRAGRRRGETDSAPAGRLPERFHLSLGVGKAPSGA